MVWCRWSWRYCVHVTKCCLFGYLSEIDFAQEMLSWCVFPCIFATQSKTLSISYARYERKKKQLSQGTRGDLFSIFQLATPITKGRHGYLQVRASGGFSVSLLHHPEQAQSKDILEIRSLSLDLGSLCHSSHAL